MSVDNRRVRCLSGEKGRREGLMTCCMAEVHQLLLRMVRFYHNHYQNGYIAPTRMLPNEGRWAFVARKEPSRRRCICFCSH